MEFTLISTPDGSSIAPSSEQITVPTTAWTESPTLVPSAKETTTARQEQKEAPLVPKCGSLAGSRGGQASADKDCAPLGRGGRRLRRKSKGL
jgi:hypothetical protein